MTVGLNMKFGSQPPVAVTKIQYGPANGSAARAVPSVTGEAIVRPARPASCKNALRFIVASSLVQEGPVGQ